MRPQHARVTALLMLFAGTTDIASVVTHVTLTAVAHSEFRDEELFEAVIFVPPAVLIVGAGLCILFLKLPVLARTGAGVAVVYGLLHILASLCFAAMAPHVREIPAIAPFVLLTSGGLNLVAGIATIMVVKESWLWKPKNEELYSPSITIPKLAIDDGAASLQRKQPDQATDKVQ